MALQIAKNIKFSEMYEINWNILNWPEIKTSKELLERQKFILETGVSNVKAKWVFGLKPDISQANKCAKFTVTLAKLYGTSHKLEVHVHVNDDRTKEDLGKISGKIGLGNTIEFRCDKLKIYDGYGYNMWKNDPYLGIKVEVRLNECPVISMNSPTPKKSHKPDFSDLKRKVSLNMEALLHDEESADTVIATSDGQAIRAHKLILRAQCPALDDFVQAELVENASRTVVLLEVSAKTLSLYLNYFYTGNLSSECFDKHCILEFASFAGKFKVKPILEMLDNSLGKIEEAITYSHVQLLDLVQYLELENAEANLLKRIIHAVNDIKTGDELFQIFPQAEKIASANFEKTSVLQIINDLVDQQDATHNHVLLLAAAQRQGLDKLSQLILDHVKGEANKTKSSDDLFALFGYTKKYIVDKSEDLLVRTVPGSLK